MDQSNVQSGRYSGVATKVPAVTVAFWITKICATTLGETGGDALSMTFKLGYAVSTVIFLILFIAALTAQVRVRRYHPAVYWSVVVATTTVGTTTSDFIDRTLRLGYIRSSIMLSALVVTVLVAWRQTAGRLEFEYITTRRDELFYWVTILISNTLGTALGDFAADDAGLGFARGALVFTALLLVVGAAYVLTNASTSVLFGAAYVLTRPLGATVGDILTKQRSAGGLAFGRVVASAVLAVAMALAVWLSESRAAGEHGSV
jgi:uncharacterized membrane-anchored protein